MKRALVTLLSWLFSAGLALAATLLPPGEQQFFDLNGKPLSGGSVYFYVPGTTTPKTTWSDSAQVNPNPNPVPLNTGGFGIIYGSGAYRMVVKDFTGSTVYDQLTYDTSSTSGTSFGGTSTGSANAQILSGSAFTLTDGQVVYFKAGFSNSGAMTLNANGTGALAVVKDTPIGPAPLTGGEVVGTGEFSVIYDAGAGQFHLLNPMQGVYGIPANIAAAGTTNLGGALYNFAVVTGSGATITSFGPSGNLASPIYAVRFASGPNTIVNSANLLTPSGKNITSAAGDYLMVQAISSGTWQILSYTPSGTKFPFTEQVLASGSGTFDASPYSLLQVDVLGAGGGGASLSASGTNGGSSVFASFSAGGGSAGIATGGSGAPGTGGAGGTGGSGSCNLRIPGGAGGDGAGQFTSAGIGAPPDLGGAGAVGPFGGAGAPTAAGTVLAQRNAVANSGSGGAGASSTGFGTGSGGGAGAGEYAKDCFIAGGIGYSYSVGAGGTGAGGTGVGGNGASGVIIIKGWF